MYRGLYTSGVGMLTQMKRMDVVTNNIANVNTTGYKKDIAVTHSFPEELTKRLHDIRYYVGEREDKIGHMSLGSHVNLIYTNFEMGTAVQTNNTYDFSIMGPGFFAVSVVDGNGNATEKYTRDGSFTLVNESGYLVTKDGYRIQGQNGDIIVPEGDVLISNMGEITVNGELLDTIKLTDFEDLGALRKFGDNLYTATEEAVETPFSSYILQGFLETSNVSTVREMVDMITVSRTYEANQKMLLAHDAILQRAVNDIAKK